MCCCDDGNYCQFFQESYRRARKPHRCSECSRTIGLGERYKAMSGRWRDSGFETFCRCEHCEAACGIIDAFLKDRFDRTPRRDRRGESHWCWCYSEMWDSARDEVRESSTPLPMDIVRLVILGSKRKWSRRGVLVQVPRAFDIPPAPEPGCAGAVVMEVS